LIDLLNVGVYRNVAQMPDYGKSVVWPKPPATLINTVKTLKRVHRRSVFITASYLYVKSVDCGWRKVFDYYY